MSIETIYALAPEVILVATATLIYLGAAFLPARGIWHGVAAAGLILAALVLFNQSWGLQEPLGSAAMEIMRAGPLAIDDAGGLDPLARYGRWLTLVVGLALVLLSKRPQPQALEGEAAGTLLLAIAGLMLAIAARELVLLFLGLELISIPTYVLLYMGRRDMQSQEAAVKYFFLSILASALTLYGFSFLYGIGRSTDLASIEAALAAGGDGSGTLAAVALVLIFAGLGFKIAAVPFHFYAPDVYQATTHANAALLSVLPKIAGLVALVRVAAIAMPGSESVGWRLAFILAVATMTLGNVLALWQDNIRRLLAYSSIAHSGYMLLGLTVGLAGGSGAARSLDGIGAMLFYLAVYSLATIGAFAVLTWLGTSHRQIDGVDELAGLARTHPGTAAGMAAFMFSLAGIPPLAGFWGKFTLFGSALVAEPPVSSVYPWLIALAIVGALNAAIGAAYYLRIIGVMYFRAPIAVPRAEGGWGAATAMLLCSVAVVAIGLYPGPLVGSSQRASQAVQKAEAKRQKDESEQAVSRNQSKEAREQTTDSKVGA
ncbi:MAG: NADH-quinone oxidoreductase subunit N [Pirellulales bacterium]